jgi:hypothetical protein
MVIDDNDREIVPLLLHHEDRVSMKKLLLIYNKYTKEKKSNCFCSKVQRIVFKKFFEAWWISVN